LTFIPCDVTITTEDMEDTMKHKNPPKKILSKKELLDLLLNHEQQELKEMDEMVDLLIAKNITINVNTERDGSLTLGEKMSDALTKFAGSWGFITVFAFLIIIWILVNVYLLTQPFDAFPFVFLNLVLGCITALQAPIIMMSQNRQEKKDRLRSENDYKINLKAEFILEDMYNKLNQVVLLKVQQLLYVKK
jgi:uncharacterized membrane protein